MSLFVSPQYIKQPDIKEMQTNEMELGDQKIWIDDGNHQLKQDASNKNI